MEFYFNHESHVCERTNRYEKPCGYTADPFMAGCRYHATEEEVRVGLAFKRVWSAGFVEGRSAGYARSAKEIEMLRDQLFALEQMAEFSGRRFFDGADQLVEVDQGLPYAWSGDRQIQVGEKVVIQREGHFTVAKVTALGTMRKPPFRMIYKRLSDTQK